MAKQRITHAREGAAASFRLLAQTLLNTGSGRFSGKVRADMKEFGNTLAQLFFIIMVMIVLAVSTATLSQWGNSDTTAASGIEQGTATAAPTLSAAATH